MHKFIYFFVFAFYCQIGQAIPDIAEYTKSMQKYEGFFDFYWDDEKGRILLEIDQFNVDFLYIHGLQSGVGSNELGLDRGQLSRQKMVRFKQFGHKVMLIQPNLSFQALTVNTKERVAVEDSFAQSVLWGTETLAASENVVLVDLSSFLLRDAHGVAGRLSAMKQGSYALDEKRSAVYVDNTKNFPSNSEFEALITFNGTKPGELVASVTPSADSLSIRLHHSFVELPQKPYKSRKYDIRSGAISHVYNDYAAGLNESLLKKFIIRHRLEKKYPNQAISEALDPIVYYLDSGTPEPVRSALLEGARWWAEAFESIGFKDAFQVKILPEDVDPLDVRYNVIQWVHRSTRGWSYGGSVVDPRTGEILKGHVTLGSLRVRQDMLIAQGLLSPYLNDDVDDSAIQDMALLRLKQLAAHEVGHTLGFVHNFSASAQGRSSVMDYPHPLLKLTDSGDVDVHNAYTSEIGEWDKVALAYSYSEFYNEEERELNSILETAQNNGMYFISDKDARFVGSSHPTAHLWDNEQDPVMGLSKVSQARKKALNRFGLNTIKSGKEIFELEQILTPIYLLHRYQAEAVSKLIGGVDYRYEYKSAKPFLPQTVSAKQQNRALDAFLDTLSAPFLAVPKSILSVMVPPSEGSYRNREHFKHNTGVNFDAIGVAQTAALMGLTQLLDAQRANRLIEQKSLANTSSFHGLDNVIAQLIKGSWYQSWDDAYLAEVQRGINWVVLHQLMVLASHKDSTHQVKAICMNELQQLHDRLKKTNKKDKYQKIASFEAIRLIDRFFSDQKIPFELSLKIPPGSPI